ncbi:hypothetical protein F8C90_10385 [Ellagibacter isourolithinifaciens]|uniref:Uncharacterized protein n=1 Tax=Ellagibacter isourolithinifaciens TaxID=2137581 RepID=A0A6N6NPK5_9ACTN|nr:hypothetical protein [Ellagibacter isourolithinifaciens]KAB1635669.1 hypothetical protein F8C90_10385 [Ellagibacter isourolithinifaciens]
MGRAWGFTASPWWLRDPTSSSAAPPTVTGIANALLAAQGKEPLSGQLIDAQVDGNPALVDKLAGATYVQLLIGSVTLVGSDGRPMLSRMA